MAVYLPGDLRFRLKNLMMDRKVSQASLPKSPASVKVPSAALWPIRFRP